MTVSKRLRTAKCISFSTSSRTTCAARGAPCFTRVRAFSAGLWCSSTSSGLWRCSGLSSPAESLLRSGCFQPSASSFSLVSCSRFSRFPYTKSPQQRFEVNFQRLIFIINTLASIIKAGFELNYSDAESMIRQVVSELRVRESPQQQPP